MITQETIDILWMNAPSVQGKSDAEWRFDPCGALIKKDHYGRRDSDYGWEVDHVVPKAFLVKAGASEGEYDTIENLRAMHWANNDSKGTNYPEYLAVRTFQDGRNQTIEAFYTVNAELQKLLRGKFGKYGI